MSNKSNRKWGQPVGLITGVMLPVVAVAVFYVWNLDKFGNWDGFMRFVSTRDILPKIMSLSVLPNLAAFFIFLRLNQFNAARGVLLSTIIIGFIMTLVRFT